MAKTIVSPNIKPAGYGRSLGGYALDFLFTVTLMLIIYVTIGTQVVMPGLHLQERRQDYASLVESSRLGDVNGIEVKDISYKAVGSDADPYQYGYEEYDKRIFHYYFVCVGQTEGETKFTFLQDDHFTTEISDKTSKAYQIEVGKWIYGNVYKIKGDKSGKGDLFFALPNTDEGYLTRPTLLPEIQAKLNDASTKEDTASKLLAFYRSPTNNDTVYYGATYHFNHQESVVDVQSTLTRIEFLSLVPSIAFSPFIFFFLIPLLSPNGMTLGKRIVKTAVLGADGYKAKKINIVIHYFIILLEFELLLIPNLAFGLMAWMFASLIGFMALVMTRNHQSIHDKIARTIVIRAKDSIWFENEEAERAYASANPSSLVARTLRERDNDGAETSLDGRRMVVTDAQLSMEDQILDLSTINRRREEARNMTSFDEFERGGLAQNEAPASNENEEEEITLSEKEKEDLKKLYGEEAEALEEELSTKEDEPIEEERVENEDEFVDGK